MFIENRDKVEKHTGKTLMENRKALVKFTNPLITKAFNMGTDYAATWLGVQHGKQNPERKEMTVKERNKILSVFITRIRQAEAVMKLKNEQKKELMKKHGLKRDDTGSDLLQKFYIGEVKKAVNFAIQDAGNLGKKSTFDRELK